MKPQTFTVLVTVEESPEMIPIRRCPGRISR